MLLLEAVLFDFVKYNKNGKMICIYKINQIKFVDIMAQKRKVI